MQRNVYTQFGRSMVEMLGVLMIISILSLAGLLGYNLLITKKSANDLFYDIQLKISSLIDKDLTQYAQTDEIPVPEFKDERFDVTMYRLNPETNEGAAYEIEIKGITAAICREILKKPFDTPYIIQVGDREFDPSDPDYSVCDQFDEVDAFNFISKAYAGTNTSIRIPMPPPDATGDSKTESKDECKDEDCKKKDCEKKGGNWMTSQKKCCMGEVAR